IEITHAAEFAVRRCDRHPPQVADTAHHLPPILLLESYRIGWFAFAVPSLEGGSGGEKTSHVPRHFGLSRLLRLSWLTSKAGKTTRSNGNEASPKWPPKPRSRGPFLGPHRQFITGSPRKPGATRAAASPREW